MLAKSRNSCCETSRHYAKVRLIHHPSGSNADVIHRPGHFHMPNIETAMCASRLSNAGPDRSVLITKLVVLRKIDQLLNLNLRLLFTSSPSGTISFRRSRLTSRLRFSLQFLTITSRLPITIWTLKEMQARGEH